MKAEDALAMGLVTQVVEPDELLDTARETAQAIMAKGPLAIQPVSYTHLRAHETLS